MSDINLIDPMVLSFERQGFYLTPRQVEFCRFMLKHGNSTRAARLAGIPDPEFNGQALYQMFRDPLNNWRVEIDFHRDLVLNGYTRMAQAVNIITNPDTDEIEEIPNDNIQKIGFEGLRKVLGLDANQGLDLNMSGRIGLPITLQEKMANAYKTADAHEQAGSE
jgi:hypothetical protein